MKTISARGATIPALGFGTWQLQGDVCAERVCDALATGYRHIDTAQRYDNHEAVGEGLRRAEVARDEVFLTTKLWHDQLGGDAVRNASERSLRELDTGYLDLLLIHWPSDDVPLEETLNAMVGLREEGLVRHVGVSNFPQSSLERAAELAPVVCNQVEYHPLLSQDHLLGSLRARDMALVAYSPLAHGEVLDDPVLREIAETHERSASQVALRWLLSQDGVAAIPKASTRRHIEDNFRVFEFDLTDAEIARIDALARERGNRTADPEFAPQWER